MSPRHRILSIDYISGRTTRRRFTMGMMMAMMFALCGGLLLPNMAAAEQTAFQTVEVANMRRFEYGIKDDAGVDSALTFRLPLSNIGESYRHFQAHDPADLRAQAKADRIQQIQAMVTNLRRRYPQVQFSVDAQGNIQTRIGPPTDFADAQRLVFDRTLEEQIALLNLRFPDAKVIADGNRYRITAPDDRQMRAIEAEMQAAQQVASDAVAAYVQRARRQTKQDSSVLQERVQAELTRIEQGMDDFVQSYFMARNYRLTNQRLLMPDYARLAKVETPWLAPVAEAIAAWSAALDGSGAGQRVLLNRLLLFTQSIPYSRLADRQSSIGFLPPLQLLDENRGDCDSKAVLFAAIAHQLYPRLPIVMVLLSNHAYLALGISPEPGDRFIERDGRSWTLAEPVGPGHTRLGELGKESEATAVEAVLRLFN
jgi:hypothetical protein